MRITMAAALPIKLEPSHQSVSPNPGLSASSPASASSSSSSGSSFTAEQIAFLRENFVFYDPLLKKTHHDFSILNRAKVICLAESHQSSIYQRVQSQFFSLFMKTPSCFLLEDLLLGERIEGNKLICWPELPAQLSFPQLSFQGADIRGCQADFFSEMIQNNHQRSQIHLKNFEAFKNCHQKFVEKANELLNTRTMIVKQDHLFFDDSAACEKLFSFVQELFAQCNAITKEGNAILDDLQKKNAIEKEKHRKSAYKDGVKLQESNQSLFKVIESTAPHFSQLIAVWGAHHYLDEDLFDAMDHANISHCVLWPNSQLLDKYDQEQKWVDADALEDLDIVVLKIATDKQAFEWKIPRSFTSFYPSVIQNILPQAKPKESDTPPNPVNLVELSTETNHVKFQANTSYSFEINIPADYFVLSDLNGQSNPLRDVHLLSVFNSQLLLANKAVLEMELLGDAHLETMISKRSLKTHLVVKTNVPWSIKTHKTWLPTSAAFLFRELVRKNITQFTIEPQQHLFFHDISEVEREHIISNPQSIYEWFSKRAPKGVKVKLEGEIIIQKATYPMGSTDLQGICLKTSKGIQIVIERDVSGKSKE